ncbi:MAG: choice-of-anchor M domain-containing protein [Planctomycetota bacterium]
MQFNEDVTGVTMSDFVVSTSGDVIGAAVTAVSGSDDTYIVSVSTGTGPGVIGLGVDADAPITDTAGNPLGRGFTGGEVYTLQRNPARVIDTFYQREHGDVDVEYHDGAWGFHVASDDLGGEFAPDEILIVGGAASLETMTSDANFAFIGAIAGEDVFILPQSNADPEEPFLGFGSVASGAFASYENGGENGAWIDIQLVDVRGPEGGQFSLYRTGDEVPIVSMATSDGIDQDDTLTIIEGSHSHMNWAFTKEGNYEIDVFASAFLDVNDNGTFDEGIDSYTESGITTLYFQMNESGDPTPVALAADLPRVVVPFALPEAVSNAPFGPVNADVADLDGDGDQDLIVIAAGEVSWMPLEDGSFGASVPIANVGGDEAVAGDIDGDGDLDVLVGESGVGLAWYANDGAGNFGPRQSVGDFPEVPDFTISTFLVDIDGDGDLDAAGNPQATGGASWFANDGDGNFGEALPLPFAEPFNFNGTFADFDGDGDQDMAVASFVLNEIRWSANDGNGDFGPAMTVSTEVNQPIGVSAADVDGDGDLDFLAADAVGPAWYANDGTGNFGPQQLLTTSILSAYRMLVEDVDGNGTLDFLIGGGGTGEVFWMPGIGPGEFEAPRVVTDLDGNAIRSVSLVDLDEDGDKDVVTSVFFGGVFTTENRLGESATAVIPPANGTYRTGQFVDVGVFFGTPVTVTGSPFVSADIGGETVQFEFAGGSGTNTLTFRYVVRSGAIDFDGIELGPEIVLGDGTLSDVIGEEITGDGLNVPATDLSGVMIDGLAPLVSSIDRVGENPTSEPLVQFAVQFDRPVVDVDAEDFGLTVEGVSNAAITNVEGSGANYVVTVRTGAGTGTIRLDLLSDATVESDAGSPLGTGFISGEVFTLHRRPERTISEFYVDNHADLAVNFIDGAWNLSLHLDDPAGVHPTDEIVTVVGPAAEEPTPEGSQWDFLGASGDSVYVLPNNLVPGIPFLGIGSEETAAGTFAAYRVEDPRVDATSRWVQLDLLDIRGPENGEFSLYSIGSEGPKVWMSSSDGIGPNDSYWSREGAHAHPAWVFTEPGLYEVDIVASGFLDANGNGTLDPGVDPYSESGVETIYFQVNESGDPTPVTLPADVLPPTPFALPVTMSEGLIGSSSVVPADFDGDGDMDILGAAFDAGAVFWFENTGDGGFGPRQMIDSEATDVWWVEPADMDGDGDLDILASSYSGDLVMYAGDGMGGFDSGTLLDTETFNPYARVVDFNGDGNVDIIAGPDFGTEVHLYLGIGGGNFDSRQTLFDDVGNLVGMLAEDFNGDGNYDFAYSDYANDSIHVNLGNGDGTFQQQIIVPAGDGAGFLEYADFNGDGLGDILNLEFNTGTLAWLENNGDGTFGARNELPEIIGGPYGITTGDIDGNGTIDVVSGGYSNNSRLYWFSNDGLGNFADGSLMSDSIGQIGDVGTVDFDGDGDTDIFAGSYSLGEFYLFENQLGEFANQVVAPAAGIYPAGQNIDVAVHFGSPVDVEGMPSIQLDIGGQTVEAVYQSGSGTPTLTFRYTVDEADRDDDGIGLVSTAVNLNGGSITDLVGDSVGLDLPTLDMPGVLVNGSTPVVETIQRSSVNPTYADEVMFVVTFDDDVFNVDAGDFGLTLDGVVGAMVTDVSGDGDEYIVTVSTGTGSGVIGLEVLETASIEDEDANPLVNGFFGGEVFTMAREDARQITTFYTEDHGDVRLGYADGRWNLDINPEEIEGAPFAPDEVLIVAGPDSLETIPTDDDFDFLGGDDGSDVYILPQTNVPPTLPDLGIGGEQITPGTFASYTNNDPRVDATGPWIEMRLVDLRGPEGGEFSVYSSTIDGPNVWIATSDGIDNSDGVFLQSGSHNHYNWAFTMPGIYEVDVVASGFLDRNDNGTYDDGVDRYTESGIVTYYFSIDPPGGPSPYMIPADPSAPVAVEDVYAVTPGNSIRGNVLLNDALSHGASYSLSQSAGPQQGSLLFNPDGTFVYTPSDSMSGADTFTYTVTDGISETTASVSFMMAALPEGQALSEGHADILVNYHIEHEYEVITADGTPIRYLLDSNDQGDMVGSVSNASTGGLDGFVLSADGSTEFWSTPDYLAYPTSINNDGVIVGTNLPISGGLPEGFIRTADGVENPYSFPGALGTIPFGINNDDLMSGFYITAEGRKGFIASLDGTIEMTVEFPDAAETQLYALSDLGLVGGAAWSADGVASPFVYDISTDTFTALPTPTPDGNYVVSSVNELGDAIVFGLADAEMNFADESSFVYDVSEGTFTQLNVPGAMETYGYDLRDDGVVLGYYKDADGSFAGFSAEEHGHWEFGILGEHDHDHDHDHGDGDHDDGDHDDDGHDDGGHDDGGHDDGDHDDDDHDHDDDDHDHDEVLHLDDVIIHGEDAGLTQPDGSEFSFTGVMPGETVYVLPQAEMAELPFLGLNTEEFETGTFVDDQISLELLSVDGPGDFSLWQTDEFGSPDLHFASFDGITGMDRLILPAGGHAHYNWGFSAEGTYRVALRASGILDGDEGLMTVDEEMVLTFVIGDMSVANEDVYAVVEGSALRGNVRTNDSVLPGAESVISGQEMPEHGILELAADGTFTYTPDETFAGEDSFTYSLSDGSTTTVAMVSIMVAPESQDFETVLTSGDNDIGVAFGEHDHDDDGGDDDHGDDDHGDDDHGDDDHGDDDHDDGEESPWFLHVHAHEAEEEYHPDEALLYVGMDALMTRTGLAASSDFDFLGVAPDETFFLLPQDEVEGLLALGFGGEEIEVGALQDDAAMLHLIGVSGPGEMSVWRSGSETPDLKMATFDGIGAEDVVEIPAGSHNHMNFAFTQMGLYAATFVATGVDADGHATQSEPATFFFQVGNNVEELDVENGENQRSHISNVDLIFGQDDGLDDLLTSGRLQITKFDLNGENGQIMDESDYSTSVDGNRLVLDFGAQGLGGNRNTNAGDGYYRIEVDIDGDGTADVLQHFYRLLGDTDGNGMVDAMDRLHIQRSFRTQDGDADINGDGVVNGLDFVLTARAMNRRLAGDLGWDD